MKRILLAFLLAASGVALASPVRAGDGAGDEEARASRVLVLSLPALTWSDVVADRPPNLMRLLERSAVASMSVRTVGPATSLGEAYATIGAGNRASVTDDVAGLAFPPTSSVEGGEARAVFERRCACSAGPAAVLHLGIAPIRGLNDGLLYEAVPGALGKALAESRLGAAVVGNADRSLVADPDDAHREAALAVMDAGGRVAAGSVGSQLLDDDPAVPFGVRTDVGATVEALEAAWSEAEVVLVEASDLDRVDAYSEVAAPEAIDLARAGALGRADDILGAALAQLDPDRDLVMVLGPTAPRAEPGQLTVAAVAGPGIDPGLARSATTRRDGYVTLPDVAPTILDALGLDVPVDMTGTVVTSDGRGPQDRDDLAGLAEDNEEARFRDRATSPTTVAFIVFQVVVYALAAAALTRWPRLMGPVTVLALMALALPPLAFLSGLVAVEGLGVAGFVVALFAAAAGLAALALGAEATLARWAGQARPLVAPLLLVGLTLTVLLVDVGVLGGRLQINTVFGYSPVVAGRFAGYGNLSFALVAISAVVVTTGAWGVLALRAGRRSPPRPRLALAAMAATLAVVVLADGHPALGSDVGGVLAMVPAFIVAGLVISGGRVGLVRALGVAGAAVAALAGFAALDLARPEDSQTHLGRLLTRASDSGGDGFVTVVARKIDTNASILASSVWTIAIPVALAFLAFLLWRRQGLVSTLDARVPGLRAGLVGALVVALLGFALNDSGVAVPAMMLGVLLPYLTVVAVRTTEC